ncbi:hypothetical protein G3495_18720 [Shewanella baltica]|uniref:hypothetical protein n=1 Tax=Shewanella baltica TaxID=62322 RepID=UPI00217DD3CA|nr:hypothetical protein [Shewanella baltica]MCS6237124.1 hypothetical protein [Shewanella baltica]MCS6272556.1 hypothetical protein [Shewanella baltica]
MDISSIGTALAGINHAIELVKTIKSSGSSLEAAEINYKFAELINALADIKIEMAGIKELVVAKDEEIRTLKDKITLKGMLIWEPPLYYLTNEKGTREGPYCQTCYDDRHKLIRLLSPGSDGIWSCNVCKSHYCDETYTVDPDIYKL